MEFLKNLKIKLPESEVKVTQSCLTLCNPMDHIFHGILQARILECVAFCFSSDLPNPGIEPRSPTSQADSLPIEPPGKAKNTAVGSLSFLQQIFLTQKLNWISCTASRFLTISATIRPSNCTSGYRSEKQKQKQKTNLN